MYDSKHGSFVTFNAPALPIPNDPKTYDEHLEFASWYHAVTSSRRVNVNVRASAKEHLSKYSLMELRAIFLFAFFEYHEEIQKGNVLDPLEKLKVWERINRQRLVVYCANSIAKATDAADKFKFEN